MADELLQGNTIAIVCKDSADPFVGTLKLHFQSKFFHVVTLNDSDTAISHAADEDTALVIIDASFDGGTSLTAKLKARPKTAMTPVLRLQTDASLRREAGQFRQLADAVIKQPCELSEVFSTANDLLAEARDRMASGETVARWAFPAECRWMDEAFESAARLFASSGLDDPGQVKLCTALREAVAGTLRLSKRPEAGAEVGVECSMGPERIVVTVIAPSDTSPWHGGRDDPWKASREYSLSLIRRCVDEASVGMGGGSLRMVKGVPVLD